MEHDTKYSSLISWMPPLFLLNWAISPFLFLSKQPSKLNTIILHIEYLPVLASIFILYAIGNLVLLPICYFKMVLHRFILVCKYSKLSESKPGDRLAKAFLFLIAGVPILLLDFIHDLLTFV